GVECLAEFGCHRHVVVVAVRADHRHHVPPADGQQDRARVVGGVEHHHLRVVADDPDVVVDFPTAAVEFEHSVGDNALNGSTVHRLLLFARALIGSVCSSRERSSDLSPLRASAHRSNTTTERSTCAAWILWKASSMSSSPMRSETNFSSGSRPCRYRLIRVGKSRSGRQSPYQDDFNAPPREKKSISGISSVMSGVGTPTSTTVPARSRA